MINFIKLNKIHLLKNTVHKITLINSYLTLLIILHRIFIYLSLPLFLLFIRQM